MEFAFGLSRQVQDQILNWNMQAAPKGILDAVNGTVHEYLKLNVLSERVLCLAAAHIGVTRLL